MRILIIGGGNVGLFIGKELSEKNEVVIVEKDEHIANKIKDSYDVLTIVGNGDDPLILQQAEIGKADALIGVSGDDRTNIMSSLVGSKHGIKNIIAKIRNPNYLEYPKTLGNGSISIVNSGAIISEKIYGLITSPFAWRTESFAEGKIGLFKLRVEENTPIVNKKLKTLGVPKSWILVGVSRGGKIFIPKGDTELQSGDYVFALGIPSVLKNLKDAFNLKFDKVDSVIIVGGGRLGRIVSDRLCKERISVKLIEKDPERARRRGKKSWET